MTGRRSREKPIEVPKGQLIEDEYGHTYEAVEVTDATVVLLDEFGELCYGNPDELQEDLRAGWLRFKPEPGRG